MPKKTLTLTAETARELLRDVEPAWKAFWFRSGVVALNLPDLVAALKNLTDDDFAHHVDKEKNDIASWVDQVLGDSTLAAKLKRAKTRSASAKAAHDRLSELQAAAESMMAHAAGTRPKAPRASVGERISKR